MLFRSVVYFLALVVTLANVSAPSHAQELSKDASLNGQKLTITMESLDAGCKVEAKIAVNKTFCFRALVKGASDAWLKDLTAPKFDAVMPGHHHGMITRPKVNAIKPGEYLIEGVKLHMAGDWTINLNLRHGKDSAQVAIPLKL